MLHEYISFCIMAGSVDTVYGTLISPRQFTFPGANLSLQKASRILGKLISHVVYTL